MTHSLFWEGPVRPDVATWGHRGACGAAPAQTRAGPNHVEPDPVPR